MNGQNIGNTTKSTETQGKILDKNVEKISNVVSNNIKNSTNNKINNNVKNNASNKVNNNVDNNINNNISNSINDKFNIEDQTQSKALPDVFKELENIRKEQIEEQKNKSKGFKKSRNKNNTKNINNKNSNNSNNKNINNKNINNKNFKAKSTRQAFEKNKKQNSNIYANNTYPRHITFDIRDLWLEKDPLAFVLLGVVAILGITMVSSNYIFAQEDSLSDNTPKEIVGTFEANRNAINLPEILTNNINSTESKEVITITQDVEFETEYYENNNLPKDEQVVTQEGVLGSEEVTFIRTYTNSEIVNDTIINVKSVLAPVNKMVDVGTNEFLANEQVHIGDVMYAKERTFLYTEPNVSSNLIGIVVQYYDVTLLEVLDDWCKVQIFDYVGYVTQASLVSSNTDPTIIEKCRKQKIIKNVGEEMAINTPSGLTLDDFKTVFSNNSEDRNKVFEENYEVFYNMEQKYGINGLFLASIGIHESNWGLSTIAQNKKNLFGYGSYDSDPYNMSYTFETYEYGIDLVAKMLTKYYINAPGTAIFDNQEAVGSYYNGSTIEAVNIRYASDTEWHTKVFNIMKSLYSKIAP